jgi:hypothetical protein
VLLEGFKKVEITGHEIETARSVVHSCSAIVPYPVTSVVGSMGPSDFHIFLPHKKQLDGK